MSVVLFSVVAFTAVIMFLVGILLFAQSKLVNSGDVVLDLNGKKQLSVPAGSSLLTTLSSQKIFLPSACGGGGTCAMCKCVVESGGGDVLPTEEGHLSRSEKAQGVRLACQVKVKENMKIHVHDEIFGIKKWECEVISNYNVASFIKEFVVRLPEGETLDFQAGGYIQVDVPAIETPFKDMDITAHPHHHPNPEEFKGEWSKFKLWDLTMKNDEPLFRAYSMANHPAEGNIVMLTIRIATPPWDRAKNGWMDVNPGVCSSYVFSRKVGDKVTISGPYGEFFIKDTGAEMIYVGGGAGMAPMRSHLFHLFHTLKTGRKVTYWYGGRSKRELFYIDDFRQIEKEFPNFKFFIVLSDPAPSDNWVSKTSMDDPNGDGFTGFVHNAVIEHQLNKHEEPEELEFYFCGPPMMNQAVLKMCDDFGVPKENVLFDDFGG